MRAIHECEWCRKKFEIYHSTDRFCSSKCRQKYWNAETAKAMGRRNLSMKQRNMPPEFVQGMNLSLEELNRPPYSQSHDEYIEAKPRQIEPRPDFDKSHITDWPNAWQCLHCGKHWPLSTVYCDCPNSDKANEDA